MSAVISIVGAAMVAIGFLRAAYDFRNDVVKHDRPGLAPVAVACVWASALFGLLAVLMARFS